MRKTASYAKYLKEDPAAAPAKKKKKRNPVFMPYLRKHSPQIIGAVSLVVLLTAGVIYAYTRPPKPAATLAVARFMATTRFAEMDSSQKAIYLKAFDSLHGEDRWKLMRSLSDEERRHLMDQWREQQDAEFLKNWLAAKTLADRDKMLDEVLDRMNRWRPTSMPTSRPGRNWMPQDRSAAQDAERHENSNPAMEQARSDFRQALQQRAAQRGMSMGFGGRGGR